MAFRLNRCVFRPTTGGTGTWTVSAAINGFRAPSQCTNPSVFDGASYLYFAESNDQSQWEIGEGVYTVSGTTLSRATIYDSTNGGAAVNFTSPPRVAMGAPLAQSIREILTADRTIYVRTDGNDSNSGLINSAGGAFLTLQGAYDRITQTYDLAGFTVFIDVVDGAYTSGIAFDTAWTGGGQIQIIGNQGTPANCTITTAGTIFDISAALPGTLTLAGFKTRTTSSGHVLSINSPARVTISDWDFNGNAGGFVAALNIDAGGYLIIISGITISDDAAAFMSALNGGAIKFFSQTITVTGTPDFNWLFALAQATGVITCAGATFSGAATGTRYLASENGVIGTGGGGATFFPGDVAGSTASGGQYV